MDQVKFTMLAQSSLIAPYLLETSSRKDVSERSSEIFQGRLHAF